MPAPVGQPVEAVDEVREPDGREQGESQQSESCLRGRRGSRKANTKKTISFESPLGLEEKQIIQVKDIERGWIDATIMSRHIPTRQKGGEWYKVKFDPKNPRSTALLDLKIIDWRRKELQMDQVHQNFLVGDKVSQVLVINVPKDQHNSERGIAAKKKELETCVQ